MKFPWLPIIVTLLLVGGIVAAILKFKPDTNSNWPFDKPTLTERFVSSIPAHGVTLIEPPGEVVINTNVNLTDQSTLEIFRIFKDGREIASSIGAEQTFIDSSRKSLRRKIISETPDGRYEVVANTCFDDGRCDRISYQFEINRSLRKN